MHADANDSEIACAYACAHACGRSRSDHRTFCSPCELRPPEILVAVQVKKERPCVIDLPVMIGARVLVRAYLDDVDAARKRVLDDSDRDALHDFRVGVRRLRSCIRAYRPHVEDTVKRRHRRWLRRMTRATNETRDIEVQLAWLRRRRRRRDLEPDAALGATRFEARLKERMWGARAKALRVIRQEFPAGRDRLISAASHYKAEIDLARPQPPTCGVVAGTAVLELADRLEAQLHAVESVEDAEPLHDARISGKRLRYLIEPFASELNAGETLIRRLRKLQDTLGKLNDCAVLARTISQASDEIAGDEPDSPDIAALAALRGVVEAERETLFHRVEHGFQRRDARPLLRKLRAVGDELRTCRMRNGSAPRA